MSQNFAPRNDSKLSVLRQVIARSESDEAIYLQKFLHPCFKSLNKRYKKLRLLQNNANIRVILILNSPIKDKRVIEQIKDLYEKKQNKRDLLLFLLAINTGYNLQDLLNLNIGDVREKYYLTLDKSKSTPLNEQLRDLIKEVTGSRNASDALFVSIRGHRLERTQVHSSFKSICKELGLADKYSVLSWRKTFAYHYYQKYGDLSYLQWIFNQNSAESALKFINEDENMNLRFREGVCL